MTNEIELGISVNDLINKIKNRIDRQQQFKFIEKLISIYGENLNGYSKCFDFNYALNSFKLFYCNDIPRIKIEHIDFRIIDIKINVDLSDLESVNSNLHVINWY